MNNGCCIPALASASLLLMAMAHAVEPPVVFVAPNGQQTALTVDGETLKRLKELAVPKFETKVEAAGKATPLRLDCPAIDRLRRDMRDTRSPGWQRAAPVDAKDETPAGTADLKHQQQQTRAWLAELERRFQCAPQRSEQR